jgi:hypothetical protein
MDLAKLETSTRANSGVFMQLVWDGKPLTDEETGEPVGITLLGSDSTVHRKAQRESTKRLVSTMVASGKQQPKSDDDWDRDSVTDLVLLTIGWQHIKVNGEKWVCSPETARKLYEGWRWIADQATAFINERSNYLGN